LKKIMPAKIISLSLLTLFLAGEVSASSLGTPDDQEQNEGQRSTVPSIDPMLNVILELKTSELTATRKREVFASHYAANLGPVLDEQKNDPNKLINLVGTYEVIRKASHGAFPSAGAQSYKTNMEILHLDDVMAALMVFTNGIVELESDKIKSCASMVTADWSGQHREEFNRMDTVHEVKKALFNKVYSDLLHEQVLLEREAGNGKKIFYSF
jgi:hypothetical protein